MELLTEPYLAQLARWPPAGRHILAQFDAGTVVVYQGYRSAIGRYAAAHRRFGGEFSLSRMSWVKPNFLWMMYRSGWGTKTDQEVTLAIWLMRDAFDAMLAEAVPSTYDPARYPDRAAWQAAVSRSEVRLQWDPDHDPAGRPLPRRALQLGLRGQVLARYAAEWLVDVQDISAFVADQRAHAIAGAYSSLVTPRELVYPVGDPEAGRRLGLMAEGETASEARDADRRSTPGTL